jgi:hypothetical protein
MVLDAASRLLTMRDGEVTPPRSAVAPTASSGQTTNADHATVSVEPDHLPKKRSSIDIHSGSEVIFTSASSIGRLSGLCSGSAIAI